MSLVGTLISFVAGKILPAADLNSNFAALKTGVNSIASTQLAADSVDANAHADISASTDPYHSGASVKITDTGSDWTTDTAQGVADQIAPLVGTGGTLTQMVAANVVSQWGITYNGRVITFATGVYSGGAGAPAAGGSGAAEVWDGQATRDFLSAPLVMVFPFFNAYETSAAGAISWSPGTAFYATSITTTGCTFTATIEGQEGAKPCWCYWIAFGKLNLA